ncbi:MAG: sigma-70 family RNA polymerase sigma factor [candidate division KSB1 bacterium]|nr:sigma-70 family RNA polymerase sigma factor [candidate division KSB1 bacterium]
MNLALKLAGTAAVRAGSSAHDETELVLLAQQGDQAAFQQLYRRWARNLYALAYHMLGNHQDADEVLQETFLRVFRHIARLRSPEAFPAWIYQITVNLCMDFRKLRTRVRWQPLEHDADGPSPFELATTKWVRNPHQVLENKELLAEITAAIAELPEQQKAVILMHEVEGLSKKMIAEVLQCSLVTVRTNLHHARKKLRKRLALYLKA